MLRVRALVWWQMLGGFPHTRRFGSVAVGVRDKRRKRKTPTVGRPAEGSLIKNTYDSNTDDF